MRVGAGARAARDAALMLGKENVFVDAVERGDLRSQLIGGKAAMLPVVDGVEWRLRTFRLRHGR